MFTRCPKCQTVFRVSAAVLQMADGDVRCGSCSEVFNALHTLVDDWSGTSFPGAALSAPVEPAPPPAEDFEFNVPEDEWQKFFISPSGAPVARQEPALGGDFAHLAVPDPPAPATTTAETRRSVEEETSDTDTWQSFLREAEVSLAPAPAADSDSDAGPDEPEADAAVVVVGTESSQHEVLLRLPAEVATDTAGDTREMPAVAVDTTAEPEAEPQLEPEPEPAETPGLREDPTADTVLDWGPAFPDRELRAPQHNGRWLAASMVAALALGAQVVHDHRDRLAADTAWGAAVRAVYGRLDQPLHPEWPLDAYEIRDMKAIADNTAPGGLDIVAEIAVNGGQPVGLPVLRVVLRDRWSNPVSSGTFVANDYLAERAPAGRLYGPGSLIPVQLTLQDPGTTAQGYELDVCLPNRQRGLVCRNLRDPLKR